MDFADFVEDREALLREFLSLKNGLLSPDTFSQVFRLLDPEAFGRAFEAFLDDLSAESAGVLAIDGKTPAPVVRSCRRPLGAACGHGLRVGARVAIGQRAVAEGENEILAARALLETLALDGLLVTGDALYAKTETAAQVLAGGGDYLFALKDDRPAMRTEVAALFEGPSEPLPVFVTTDADHGRLEVRRYWTSHDADWVFPDRRYAGEPAMPGLATISRVETERTVDGRTSRAVRHYLSSSRLTPERFAQAVRALGDREQPARVLDVTFDEDRARNRKEKVRRTSRSCDGSPSISSTKPSPRFRSAENASAPAGPTPSPEPSSVKCDSPELS